MSQYPREPICHLRGLFQPSHQVVGVACPDVCPWTLVTNHRSGARRPNSSRRLHPGIPPGSTERIPVQATARVLPPTTARTGWDLSRRCCAASASLSCPDTAPQYVHTCFTRLLTGTVKATWTPLPIGQRRRGIRNNQDSDGPAPRLPALHELHPAHDGTVAVVALVVVRLLPLFWGLPRSPASQSPTASRLHARTQPRPTPRLQSTPPPDGCFCRRSPAAPATLSRSYHSHRFPLPRDDLHSDQRRWLHAASVLLSPPPATP